MSSGEAYPGEQAATSGKAGVVGLLKRVFGFGEAPTGETGDALRHGGAAARRQEKAGKRGAKTAARRTEPVAVGRSLGERIRKEQEKAASRRYFKSRPVRIGSRRALKLLKRNCPGVRGWGALLHRRDKTVGVPMPWPPVAA